MLKIQLGTMSRCHKYLDGMGNINQRSVQKLPQEVKEFLRNNSPVRLKELAQMNCYAADKIKKDFDKKYGEKNYVLVAIGRSISSMVELMGNMGADTKIIPMSGLKRGEIGAISPKDLLVYKSFLNQIGISRDELDKNKDKTYIFMDYTSYGRTIEKMEKLLKQENMLGDASNLIFVPIFKILGEDYEKRGYRFLFEYCRFKDYSYVGKLPFDELRNVYKKSSPEQNEEFRGNITKGLRKLFWFNVYDSLKKQSYKNILPINEIGAVHKHFEDKKAVNNRLKREFAKMNNLIGSLGK